MHIISQLCKNTIIILKRKNKIKNNKFYSLSLIFNIPECVWSENQSIRAAKTVERCLFVFNFVKLSKYTSKYQLHHKFSTIVFRIILVKLIDLSIENVLKLFKMIEVGCAFNFAGRDAWLWIEMWFIKEWHHEAFERLLTNHKFKELFWAMNGWILCCTRRREREEPN